MEGSTASQTPYFLIYQMGKVGSSSLLVSVSETFGPANVRHTHDHTEAAKLIQERREAGQPVVVLTGFREPLSRCISAYFENLANPTNAFWFVGPQEEVLGKDTDWLIADYGSKIRRHIAERVAPWLDRYERSIGLGASAFEKRDGFWTASNDGLCCYVYKFENLPEFVGAAANEAAMRGLALRHENVGDGKWSGELYKAFRDNFRMTRSDYASIYGGLDYVEWLYDDVELEQLTARYLTG